MESINSLQTVKPIEKYFLFAKQAGIKTLTADPSADSFDNLEELVQEFDIRVAIP